MRPERAFVRPLLLALLASLGTSGAAAAAEGLNLAWNHCLGQGTGVQNMVFACDTNDGVQVITGSFVLSSPSNQINGVEVSLDLAAASATLPPWWSLANKVGACRRGSLSANGNADPTDLACPDWAQGGASLGIACYAPVGTSCGGASPPLNGAHILLGSALPFPTAHDLSGGIEYFAFHLVMDDAKTVPDAGGTLPCSGCDVPVCIVLNSIKVDAGAAPGRLVTGSTVPGSNFVTWQGGGVPVVNGISGCPAATAAHRSAWGQLKALYR